MVRGRWRRRSAGEREGEMEELWGEGGGDGGMMGRGRVRGRSDGEREDEMEE